MMATKKRLIWLDDVKKRIIAFATGCHSTSLAVDAVIMILNQAPTVDAVEVVHGRWIRYHEADIGWDEYGVRCSNCGLEVEDHEVKFSMNYCPNCGAKMDGGNRNVG